MQITAVNMGCAHLVFEIDLYRHEKTSIAWLFHFIWGFFTNCEIKKENIKWKYIVKSTQILISVLKQKYDTRMYYLHVHTTKWKSVLILCHYWHNGIAKIAFFFFNRFPQHSYNLVAPPPNHIIGLARGWHIRPLKQIGREILKAPLKTVFTHFGKSTLQMANL